VSATGIGGLTIFTNDGGAGGTFSFSSKGRVTFKNLGSALTINGSPFTLVNSLPTLASAVGANTAGAFALANNYDASQDRTYSQSPIAYILEGTIEGLGNTISNLSINNRDQDYNATAMIQYVDTPGVIENFRLTKVNIQDAGADADLGGLVSISDGYLFNDSVTGTITGTSETALVAGLAEASGGMVVSCWANVSATGGGKGGRRDLSKTTKAG
jgi:hypothetical protein